MARAGYVLDANVFIEAARRYYAFDLAPPFWASLIKHANDGRVESIDRVREELGKGKDELTEWAHVDFSHAFCSTDDEAVIEAYGDVVNWVQAQPQFTDAAKADFANLADGWLVAYAVAKGRIVVTHELPNTETKKKVPIPNVCEAFDVDYVNTFAILRDLGVRFA